AGLLEGRGATAGADHAVPRDLADHQCLAAIRRDLRDNQGRPGRRDDRRRLLPVSTGVPVLQRWVRIGNRLCAFLGDPGRPGHPTDRRTSVVTRGARLMTHPTALPPIVVDEPHDFRPAGTSRRRRPSGWHFLLLPLALVMLTPLAWMVITA